MRKNEFLKNRVKESRKRAYLMVRLNATKIILSKIEPLIEHIVSTEFKDHTTKLVNLEDFLEKINSLTDFELAATSLELVEEIEKEKKRLENIRLMEDDLQESMEKTTKKVIFLIEKIVHTIKNPEPQDLYSSKGFPPDSKKGLTGFENIGNICFMNSALQCLSNTYDLTVFFLTNEYRTDLNRSPGFENNIKLVTSYAELMKKIWFGNSSSVSPTQFRNLITTLKPQFLQSGKQDPYGIIIYLLNALHGGLNRVKGDPLLVEKDKSKPDYIFAEEAWDNHLRTNQSRIQELMHGQFKSTIKCVSCKASSVNFELYTTVSLQIPTLEDMAKSKQSKFFLYFIFDDSEKAPMKIDFDIPTNTSYTEIISRISEIAQVSKKNIIMGFKKDYQLIEFADNFVDALYIQTTPNFAFAYEVPDLLMTQDIESRSDENISGSRISGINSSKKSASLNPSVNVTRINIYGAQEKRFAYTRIIRIIPSDSFQDIHLKIYKKMRPHLYKYFDKKKTFNPINFDLNSSEAIAEEYNLTFPENDKISWIYSIFINRNSNPDPNHSNQHPCILCQKIKCQGCFLPNNETKIGDYLDKMKINPKDLILDLKIASGIDCDSLQMNKCVEKPNEEKNMGFPDQRYSIYDCLNLSLRKQKIERSDWICPQCKSPREAMKIVEFYKSPSILIVHLQRFKPSRYSSSWGIDKKIIVEIDFPIEGLDISDYLPLENQGNAMYDLFAVINHHGNYNGGHYTAYAKNPITGNWFEFDDSKVTPINQRDIVTRAAYILFYKKI